MARSDLYIVDRTYEFPKFIPWDGTIAVVSADGSTNTGQISPLPSSGTTSPTSTYPIAISPQSIDDWVDRWSDAFWATDRYDDVTGEMTRSPLQDIRSDISNLPQQIGEEIATGLGQSIGEEIAAVITPALNQLNQTIPVIGSQVGEAIAPEIAALTEAIQELNVSLTTGLAAIEQKLTIGVSLTAQTIAQLGAAVQRPNMEFRARAIQITNQQWTSPAGLQAIAISNRGTVAGTFTDVDESGTAKAVPFVPRATWSWAVSEDIDKIAPITVEATGTTITASYLQQIVPVRSMDAG